MFKNSEAEKTPKGHDDQICGPLIHDTMVTTTKFLVLYNRNCGQLSHDIVCLTITLKLSIATYR